MLRILALFALTFVGLPAFCEERTAPEPRTDYMKPFRAPDDSSKSGQFNLPVRAKGFQYYLSPNNDVCYTIHTLQVAREPGSDTTRLLRQRTCTPATQFQMKHSAQQPK